MKEFENSLWIHVPRPPYRLLEEKRVSLGLLFIVVLVKGIIVIAF